MNLLVTNTRNAQAYAIIRALRPYANKIVATMEGDHWLAARLSHAANSRLVDKRYYTPLPTQDWRAGRIQRENTGREESYIQAVLRICEREKIDTIFPSFDPHVYVFAKNKERFEKLGILIPVPDYETVIIPLDKYRTIQAAMEVGFPCPKTYLPESAGDLKRIAEELGFPLVIKPRFTAGGRGMAMVRDLPELLEKTRLTGERQGMPMIQEWIPGRHKQLFYLTLDKSLEVKVAFCPKSHRAMPRIDRRFSPATESRATHPYLRDATTLVRRLGWWGGATVETKIDSRDAMPKLMEVNPRLGYMLWMRTELGINEPLICLKIAREQQAQAVADYREGTIIVSPLEDALFLGLSLLDLLVYKFRIGLLGKAPFDPSNPPRSLREIVDSYKETYFLNRRKKILNPYLRYFFQDPLVSLIWWCQFSPIVLHFAKGLGR